MAYLWCKVVYNYLKMLKIGSNLYPRSEPIFFQYQARCDFNVSGFYFNSYCFILNLINS
nr:MAG TPA: hypothetical protein [Caudoviricetes sp.]